MNEKGKIIRFRVGSQRGETLHDDGGVSEMEFWEAYQELIDRQDYPGLVRYAKQQAERYPNYSHESGKGMTLIMNRWFKEKYFYSRWAQIIPNSKKGFEGEKQAGEKQKGVSLRP